LTLFSIFDEIENTIMTEIEKSIKEIDKEIKEIEQKTNN